MNAIIPTHNQHNKPEPNRNLFEPTNLYIFRYRIIPNHTESHTESRKRNSVDRLKRRICILLIQEPEDRMVYWTIHSYALLLIYITDKCMKSWMDAHASFSHVYISLSTTTRTIIDTHVLALWKHKLYDI